MLGSPSSPTGQTAILAALAPAVLVAFAISLLCRHGLELRPTETLKERVRSGLLLVEILVGPLSDDPHQAGNPREERRELHCGERTCAEDRGMALGCDSQHSSLRGKGQVWEGFL